MIDYIKNNYPDIQAAFLQHLWLALIPIVVGAVLALPVGYLAVRRRWLYQPIVNLGGIVYSIPSLALFVLIPAVINTGVLSKLNVLIGLSLYTLALLARSVADALISVQGQTTQAAHALGYRPLGQLFAVELPMAVPVLFAGLRLGVLFTNGFQLGFVEPIIIGIVLSVLLAAAADVSLVLLQRRLTPWARAGSRA